MVIHMEARFRLIQVNVTMESMRLIVCLTGRIRKGCIPLVAYGCISNSCRTYGGKVQPTPCLSALVLATATITLFRYFSYTDFPFCRNPVSELAGMLSSFVPWLIMMILGWNKSGLKIILL